MNIKSLAEPKAWHMSKWARSVVPPLFGGLLGGAIAFVALLIATIAYLDVLHEFQTLVSGILAIIASLVVLFGVYVRLSYDRKVEENKLRRDAFAFATALLRQTEDFQSKISLIYHLCNSAVRDGSYEHGVRRFCVVNEPEKEETQSGMGYFLRQQVGYYEDMIEQELQALISWTPRRTSFRTDKADQWRSPRRRW